MQSRRICITTSLRRSVLALLVLVLGHLASWAHEGATRHVLCAQHGEMVDAPQLSRAVATGAWLIAVDGDDGGDEHCALADGMRHDVATTHAFVAQTAIVVTAQLAVTPRSFESHIDVLTAPKTSPPVC